MTKFVAYAIVFLFIVRTCVASGLVAIIIEMVNNSRNKRSSRSKNRINAAENRRTGRNTTSSGRSGCDADILNITVPSPIPVISPSMGVPLPPKRSLAITPRSIKGSETPLPQMAIPEPAVGLGSPPILPDKPLPTYIVHDEPTKGLDGITILPTINNKVDNHDVEVPAAPHYDDKILQAEDKRLRHDPTTDDGDWRMWGPYLSDREWCTVREDFSAEEACWEYFSHDDARSKVFHYGEDGLLGLTDENCTLCFGIGLWNEKDPILKERLYGLTGPEGNHGEDMKECVYYLDSTPTHSYMKALYKYPQREFPYQWIIDENRRRDVFKPEFELVDTGIFNDDRYFDVMVEYAKESPDDILIRAVITNRGPDASTLHFIPQLWYRNKWSLDRKQGGKVQRPSIRAVSEDYVVGHTPDDYIVSHFIVDRSPNGSLPKMLFTNNETNYKKKHSSKDNQGDHNYFKDGFHEYIINGVTEAVNNEKKGSKFGAQYILQIPSKGEVTLKFRLSSNTLIPKKDFGYSFDAIFDNRILEADAFYSRKIPTFFTEQERTIARQAYAGMLWNKIYYEFNVNQWLKNGCDPANNGTLRQLYKNSWSRLHLTGILSVADKWEYPWYSNWHMGFSVIQLAKVDSQLAMNQLLYILDRDNTGQYGELPSCEYNFSSISPPITAWTVFNVYAKANKDTPNPQNMKFLKLAFQAMTFQFKEWLMKGDSRGKGIIAGGFSRLNNIGYFDCSNCNSDHPVEQTDLTCWSLFYCGNLIKIGCELVQDEPEVYDEIVTRLCQSYMTLLDVMKKQKTWNEHDGFFYNRLRCDKLVYPVLVRSISNLVPLFSCLTLQKEVVTKLPQFRAMILNHQNKKHQYVDQISFLDDESDESVHLMSVPTALQLKRVLKYVLDENEFLSPYGIRSLSKHHKDNPYNIMIKHQKPYTVRYEAGESTNHLFGGNNNFSGPIWINMNYLIIEALEAYYSYFGDNFMIECPTGSGKFMNLLEVSQELSARISRIFLKEGNGVRPCHGIDPPLYRTNEHWKELLLFHESFNGDTGKGCGANHATGLSALVIDLMHKKYNKFISFL